MEEVQDSDNLSSVETEDTEVDLCDDMLLSFLTPSDFSGGFRGGSLGSDEPPLFLILNCKLQGINLIYHA